MTNVSPPGSTARPGPSRRTDFNEFLPITTRWMDNDVLGHVNNVAYYSFVDTAVCDLLVRRGLLMVAGGAQVMVVAESSCRYHRALAFPDRVTAGLRVVRLGGSSVRYAVGIFREDEALAAADAVLVHVCVDAASRRPVALPPRWRDVLATLINDQTGD